MKTNKQMAEKFCRYYRDYKKDEEKKRSTWKTLYKKWEDGNFTDDKIRALVGAAEKEYVEVRLMTLNYAKKALDFAFKDQEPFGSGKADTDSEVIDRVFDSLITDLTEKGVAEE